MNNEKSVSIQNDDAPSRELLAAIYGESPALGVAESLEFEATRDALHDFMNEAPAPALQARLRAALEPALRDDVAPAARVTPINETLWILPARGNTLLPVAKTTDVAPGSWIVTPPSGHALARLPDGSEIMLSGSTRLRVTPIKGRSHVAALESGRLYAWVARQTAGRFSINTPGGAVSVLGTEFDVEVNAPGRIEVLVTHGSVRFETHDGKTPETLSRNHSLRIDNDARETRVLPRREVLARTAWATSDRRRGRVLVGVLALLLLALAAVGAWIYLSPSTTATITPVSAQQASVTAPAPADLTSAPRVRIRVYNEQRLGNQWTPQLRMSAVVQRSQATPDGAEEVHIKLEEYEPLDSQGNPDSGPLGTRLRAALQGATFKILARPDGNISLLDTNVQNGFYQLASIRFIVFAMNNPERLLPGRQVNKGESWNVSRRGNIESFPGATYDLSAQVTYEGLDPVDNTGHQVYSAHTRGIIENVETASVVVSQVVRTNILRRFESRADCKFWFDPVAGHVTRYTSMERKLTNPGLRLKAPGKEPIESNLPRELEESQINITYEYLD